MPHLPTENPRRLRELAAWYRASAARAGSNWVWEARLQTAEALEREADRRDGSQGENP
jgi:hypothetical protein